MKVENYLPKSSQEKISASVKDAEAKVQAEIVPVFMTSSDAYTEADLRGALAGAALTTIGILLYDHLMGWYQAFVLTNDWLFTGTIALGGVIGYFATRFIPGVKKLFLSKASMDARTLAMAERVFGEYRLFETSSRTGILIFVSLFEHSIKIIPDKGLRDKIADDEWQKVVSEMKPYLRSKKFDEAFIHAISMSAGILEKYGFIRKDGTGNELPDHLRQNI